jgi:large conductance mechanosensitive channel
MGFIRDFKEFAIKGNVIDLAVGVVIGGAFGKIVTAVVDDLIMPLISMATNGVKFTDRFIVLKEGGKPPAANTLEAFKASGANVFAYGHFLQMVADFLIIAFSIFLVIRFVVNRRKKAEEPDVAASTASEALLTEIRDLLKTNNRA